MASSSIRRLSLLKICCCEATFLNYLNLILWATCCNFYGITCYFTLCFYVMKMTSFLKPHETTSAIFILFFCSFLIFSLFIELTRPRGLPLWLSGKGSASMWEIWALSLDQEDPLEKRMATHSSILLWRILWIEEPGGLQSTGSQSWTHIHRAFLWIRLWLKGML